MGRSTIYNANQVTEAKWAAVSEENKELLSEFLDYLKASDKSPQTIYQYESQLKIVFCWISEKCHNKLFCDMKKREWVKFIGYLTSDIGASPNRISSIKSAISSLSNFIELIMDEEYPNFRNIIKNIPVAVKTAVREKTVLTNEQVDNCIEELLKQNKIQIACCLAVLAASGMRRSEIIQMKMSDFTEDRLVYRGLMYETAKIRTKGSGTKGKIISRLVFKDVCQEYLDKWLQERDRLGIKSEYLFVHYRNGQWQPAQISTINSWFEQISSIIGESVYPHALRHYAVTALARKGYPDSVIQKMIRWSSADMVQIYNDMDDTEQLDEFFKNLEKKGE